MPGPGARAARQTCGQKRTLKNPPQSRFLPASQRTDHDQDRVSQARRRLPSPSLSAHGCRIGSLPSRRAFPDGKRQGAGGKTICTGCHDLSPITEGGFSKEDWNITHQKHDRYGRGHQTRSGRRCWSITSPPTSPQGEVAARACAHHFGNILIVPFSRPIWTNMLTNRNIFLISMMMPRPQTEVACAAL